MAMSSPLSYVEIPIYARQLGDSDSPSGSPIIEAEQPRKLPRIMTSFPHSDALSAATASPRMSEAPLSPKQSTFNIPALLLSSALPSGPVQSDPRHTAGQGKLLSSKDPLSIPITTTNFRRFVGKIGPVFWFQDRVEEIITWKKGWKVTCVWMAAYAFLCYFPALVLVLPNVLLISILLATFPSPNDTKPDTKITPPGEGSVDWQANLQAIQNLMGAYSDLYDAILPLLPHLMHQTPVTSPLLIASIVLLVLSVPVVSFIPLRPVCLTMGLAPFILAHPVIVNRVLPVAIAHSREFASQKHLRQRLLRTADDDHLEDKHWRSELREVELWENERWVLSSSSAPALPASSSEDSMMSAPHVEPVAMLSGSWSKLNLRAGERLAWTRGRDGWSAVGADGGGMVSNLTFSLDAGWGFVETENWRPDLEASWAASGGDDAGWVYSNDVWMDGSALPRDEWAISGMTRRRRWIRRIYCDHTVS